MFKNIKDAYRYISMHPEFESYDGAEDGFSSSISFEIVMVDPLTKEITGNSSIDTEVRFWFEGGPFENGYCTHDIRLDVGGTSFEDGLLRMAEKIKEFYG